MDIIVYIATSIDGYIADKKGSIDWLTQIENPENSDFGFEEFIQTIDAIVMGRATFETILSFDIPWPYNKPVYVLSHTLKKLPAGLAKKVFLMQGSAEEIIEKLSNNHFDRIYIDGGKTVQGFLAQGKVDELIITRVPILLGEGKPLFIANDQQIDFQHIKTEIYVNSLVKSHYKRK